MVVPGPLVARDRETVAAPSGAPRKSRQAPAAPLPASAGPHHAERHQLHVETAWRTRGDGVKAAG